MEERGGGAQEGRRWKRRVKYREALVKSRLHTRVDNYNLIRLGSVDRMVQNVLVKEAKQGAA